MARKGHVQAWLKGYKPGECERGRQEEEKTPLVLANFLVVGYHEKRESAKETPDLAGEGDVLKML